MVAGLELVLEEEGAGLSEVRAEGGDVLLQCLQLWTLL